MKPALLRREWMRQLCVELCLFAHKHAGLLGNGALFSLVLVFLALHSGIAELHQLLLSNFTITPAS